jgi:hypothetical protein
MKCEICGKEMTMERINDMAFSQTCKHCDKYVELNSLISMVYIINGKWHTKKDMFFKIHRWFVRRVTK